VGLVDRALARDWSRWPWIIGTDGGGCLRTWAEVTVGKVVR
jgi:hypothetical protein